MKANKRIRNLKRRSTIRLYVMVERAKIGSTTYPTPDNKVLMELRNK